MISRWQLSGDPHGVAAGPDGTLYVGLRGPQSIVAIDPGSGRVLREVILDQEEIASTKDFESIRIDQAKERILIAQGSDESVTILSLRDLAILREIGLEGEVIRDVLPDPKGRYLFILGRTVHVRDADGQRDIREFGEIDPMAIAVSSDGSLLAIVGAEEFPSGAVTVVSLIDLARLEEIRRDPLQTDRAIEAALFAAGDGALLVLASDWLAEKPLALRDARPMTDEGGTMRMRIESGDLLSSEAVCLSEAGGPMMAARAGRSDLIVFAERRCSTGGSLIAAPRRVETRSIYGVDALALAYHPKSGGVVVVEKDGVLTLYRAPEARTR